jgi:hypothetical protein
VCVPGACDDGDACTTDTCDPLVGCVATPVGGLPGAACLLGQLTDPDVCGADPIDAKLAKFVNKRVTRALRAIDKASEVSTARKVLKQLRKVGRELKKIARRVARFERKERITPECAAAFRDLLCRAVSETDVADVLPPPCPF